MFKFFISKKKNHKELIKNKINYRRTIIADLEEEIRMMELRLNEIKEEIAENEK